MLPVPPPAPRQPSAATPFRAGFSSSNRLRRQLSPALLEREEYSLRGLVVDVAPFQSKDSAIPAVPLRSDHGRSTYED